MDSGWLLGEILGKCLGLLNSDDWTRVRAAVAGPFHNNKSASYLPLIQGRVDKHFRTLQAATGMDKTFFKVRPAEDLKMLAFWILGDIIYGGLTEDMERRLLQIVPLRESIWNGVMAGGLSRFTLGKLVPSSTYRTLAIFQREWADFNKAAYERAKKESPNAPILTMYPAVENGQLSKTELLHTLDEMLFANLDVTIGNISWNPIFLAANLDIQNELRSEVLRARADTSSNSWGNYITSNSTLLMACVLESARLKPMAPFSLAQATPTDRYIGDWVIPAGTNIVIDTHAINILDPHWGADNTVYRPKRFLEARTTEMRYRFWRYGFGPRQCLGKSVADVVLKNLLAFMVENFRIELSNGESQDPEDWRRKADSWISSSIQEIFCREI